jgi:hypothetical protein
MKQYIFIFIIAVFAFPLQAQERLSESARISILTISPWTKEVYARFGHTGVWVRDDSLGINKVFDYGMFDMSAPNFIFNFVRGHTDYYVAYRPFERFIAQYMWQGVEVVEQLLNLTQEEKQNLYDAMYINALPENRVYRYNFFFDNCVTRPRDLLEKYVQGMIYPEDTRVQTFRDLIHECVSPYPWLQFGIDLVIGNEADIPITLREKMFLPVYFMNALAETVVVRDGISSPLVAETNVILQVDYERNRRREQSIFSPLVTAFVILFFAFAISLIQRKNRKAIVPKIFDSMLFFAAGTAGLVVFFLMFFSEHPATNPNWNLVWINPLALLFSVLFWIKALRKIVFCYHFSNFAVLTLFLLMWWLIPQQLHLATLPFAASLWLRAGINAFLNRKQVAVGKHKTRSVSNK